MSLATFRIRYPAFESVSDDTVNYWLGDADAIVSGWAEAETAAMAYAAHHISLSVNALPQGVTSFRSGVFSATVSDAQASRTGYSSTAYGLEFLAIAGRCVGSIHLVSGYAE